MNLLPTVSILLKNVCSAFLYASNKSGCMGATYSLTTRIKSRSFMPKEAKSNSSARSERKYSSRSETRRSSSGDDCLDCSMNELTSLSIITAFGESGVSSLIPARERHLLSATYSCPGANDCPASITALSKVSPWLLCIVIAQARRNGICANTPSVYCLISFVSSSTR